MGAEVYERARPHLTDLGAIAGDELDALAAVADRNPPVLRAWDERGRRVDEVVRHPAYRRMEEIAFSRFGLAAMAHRPGVLGWPGRAPQVLKYALSYLFAQAEFGLLCPVNMTDSCARMLGAFGSEELKARYLPHLTTTESDALWQGTQWMTERTGGSDVGASTTVARRGADGQWRLWGDKWFTSVANAELALTLARPEGAPEGTRGLAMFLVPKRLPDGSKNAWTINRLKDKLGSRSMATGEVTYAGAVGVRGGRARLGLQADDGDGQRLAAVQRDARGRHHAARPARVAGARAAARGLRPAADRAAAAAQQPARHAARRGGGGLGDPERRRAARPARHRVGRGARARAGVDAARQVLDHAAGPRRDVRGHERPRRQRLRRGVGEPAPAARRLPRRDLGGLGQRGGARRPARDRQGPRARGAGRLHGRATRDA